MKTFLYGSAALFVAAPVLALECEGLTPEALGLEGVTFTEVAALDTMESSAEANENVAPAAQCRIRGSMAQRTGADGREYALRFELVMPDSWGGKLLHQFNGGNDGVVKPATGILESGTAYMPPIYQGFAIISSDAGHDGAAFGDMGLAGGAGFGHDFEARQMYGYKAVALLQPVAEQIVEAYYENPIDYSYGIGCSNGGRHGMVAAARMPEAFDGLLIGAPGFNLPRAGLQHALDVQAFVSAAPETSTGLPSAALRMAFSEQDLRLVADGILESCDMLDGYEDGLVHDTAACQQAFDITALQCSEGQNSACLSAAQVTALQTVHAGPKGADGEQLYADWAWDPGIAGADWRFWKLQSTVPPWNELPIIAVMGASSLAQVFTTPPTEVGGAPEDLLQFLLDFDIPAQAGLIDATSDAYPESPMQVMSPPGADDPELAEFRDAGGKMIIYHGVADQVFSVNDTANWYSKLDKNNGGNAEDFALFYPVPGMNHCHGGPAGDEFDLLVPLIKWVEQGATPGQMPDPINAMSREDNPETPEVFAAEARPGMPAMRPLCPWPLVARYQGGPARTMNAFACEP